MMKNDDISKIFLNLPTFPHPYKHKKSVSEKKAKARENRYAILLQHAAWSMFSVRKVSRFHSVVIRHRQCCH